MNVSLEEYTDLLKKYEELRQEKIKILNKYYVEKDDLKQEIETYLTLNKQLLKDIDKAGKEIERLQNIIKEVRELIEKEYIFIQHETYNKLLKILDKGE